MDRTSRRLGGTVLLLGGLCGLVGGLLHGPQPGSLEGYAELGTGWTVSHVGIALAGTLLAVGALFLARRFAGSAGEGWALLGTGTLLLTGIALLAVGVLETTGFSTLQAMGEGGQGAGARHGFLATTAVMTALAGAGGYLLPTASASYGVGMLAGSDWPRWLGWAGAVIGVAALALQVLGITVPSAPSLPLYLLMAWFAAAGVALWGSGRESAPAPEPAPAPEGAASPQGPIQ